MCVCVWVAGACVHAYVRVHNYVFKNLSCVFYAFSRFLIHCQFVWRTLSTVFPSRPSHSGCGCTKTQGRQNHAIVSPPSYLPPRQVCLLIVSAPVRRAVLEPASPRSLSAVTVLCGSLTRAQSSWELSTPWAGDQRVCVCVCVVCVCVCVCSVGVCVGVCVCCVCVCLCVCVGGGGVRACAYVRLRTCVRACVHSYVRFHN